MNKAFLIIPFLASCSCLDPKIVYVDKEVFVAPKFVMPERPKARSYDGTDGEVVRNTELDLLDVSTYAEQLENVLKQIKNDKPINN